MSKLLFLLYLVAICNWGKHVSGQPPGNRENSDSSTNRSSPAFAFLHSYLTSIKARVDLAVDKFRDTCRIASYPILEYQNSIDDLKEYFEDMIRKDILMLPSESENRTLPEASYKQHLSKTNSQGQVSTSAKDMDERYAIAKNIASCFYKLLNHFKSSLKTYNRNIELRTKKLQDLYDYSSKKVCANKSTADQVRDCLRDNEQILDNFMTQLPQIKEFLCLDVAKLKTNVEQMKTCADEVDLKHMRRVRSVADEIDIESAPDSVFEWIMARNNISECTDYNTSKPSLLCMLIIAEESEFPRAMMDEVKNSAQNMTQKILSLNKTLETYTKTLSGDFERLKSNFEGLQYKITEFLQDYILLPTFDSVLRGFQDYFVLYGSMNDTNAYAGELRKNTSILYDSALNVTNCYAKIAEAVTSISRFFTHDYEQEMAELFRIQDNINGCLHLSQEIHNPTFYFTCFSGNDEDYERLDNSSSILRKRISTLMNETIKAFNTADQVLCTNAIDLEATKEIRESIAVKLHEYFYG